MNQMYPKMLDYQGNRRSYSLQSLLFGHRIKPQQTLYEYLIEFLIVAMAKKEINGNKCDEMFPLDAKIDGGEMKYMPVSNMGLKRFIFFENSRIDTRAAIDKRAYQKCCEIMEQHITSESGNYTNKDCEFILQNVLYGFSVENAGRSWFVKNLLPVCADVLFPEALGKHNLRQNVDISSYDVDRSFEYNSYTYMCRGGEVYYLHLLHAINANPEKKERIETLLNRTLNSMPEIAKISRFIQNIWSEEMKFDEEDVADRPITKTLGAIPASFAARDSYTITELEQFLSCKLQPMEKLNLFAYGQILQMLRVMFSVASNHGNVMWIMDMSEPLQREQVEIRKLCAASYVKNEESIIKYLQAGLEQYYSDEEPERQHKLLHDAEKDSYKLFRKLAKRIGILIPLNGPNMRFTLSEEIIKFLVMALIPASSKVTYDQFLKMMYEHFGMIITQEHYHDAVRKGNVALGDNVTFLNANKTAFAQKLKDCGFLRDLSDATAIVENPYEMEV